MPDLTHHQKCLIVRDLREGFGAEDIAVRHGLDAGAVRERISDMRTLGTLRPVIRQGERERAARERRA